MESKEKSNRIAYFSPSIYHEQLYDDQSSYIFLEFVAG